MRLLFIGSKNMGCLALEELLRQELSPVAVVARWDDPQPDQWYGSVSRTAEANGLPLLKPTNINEPSFVEEVKALQPDLMLTCFYPKLFKKALLSIPPLGSLNLHFAPLPRYRGSFPGAWAIINGESEHGVTLHHMAPGVDNGPIFAQRMVPISQQDTGQSLYAQCEEAGAALLREEIPNLKAGTIRATPQDEDRALYYDRNIPYGRVVNFGWRAQQVYDYVRGLTFPPFPNPYSYLNGRQFTVQQLSHTEEGQAEMPPGTVLSANAEQILVQCGDGRAAALTAVNDNRNKPLPITAFQEQYGVSPGVVFGR